MILPKIRDPRLILIRRGGRLTDADHSLLAIWAADCAERVLPLFEKVQLNDDRPRRAIDAARAWADGRITVTEAKTAGGHAMAAARPLIGAARLAAYAAGQAAVVAHVAAHDLGAAAYAIRAVMASVSPNEGRRSGIHERDRQRELLPEEIRELVLDDQKKRNDICWSVFEPGQDPISPQK